MQFVASVGGGAEVAVGGDGVGVYVRVGSEVSVGLGVFVGVGGLGVFATVEVGAAVGRGRDVGVGSPLSIMVLHRPMMRQRGSKMTTMNRLALAMAQSRMRLGRPGFLFESITPATLARASVPHKESTTCGWFSALPA